MVWVNRRIIAFAVAFLGGLAFIIYSFVTIGANESLIYVAVVVAACAAIASLLSFQWARDTIRPFVYFTGDIDVGGTEANKHITFHIGNSGQIPASNVRINIVPFGIEEEMTIGNIGKIYSFPKGRDELIMIFPTRGFQWVEEFDMKKPEEKGIWESIISGKVKLRIEISYESLRRRHQTVQSIHIDQFDAKKLKLWGVLIEPQTWK